MQWEHVHSEHALLSFVCRHVQLGRRRGTARQSVELKRAAPILAVRVGHTNDWSLVVVVVDDVRVTRTREGAVAAVAIVAHAYSID